MRDMRFGNDSSISIHLKDGGTSQDKTAEQMSCATTRS